MSKVIISALSLLLFIACSPKASQSVADNPRSNQVNVSSTPFARGQDLLNKIRLLPLVKVSGDGAQAKVQLVFPDGSISNLNPVYVLDGKVYDGDFSQVYREVAQGKMVNRVRRLDTTREIVRYGLQSGVVVEITTVMKKTKNF